MTEGHYARHLRRTRALYAGRRAALQRAVDGLALEIHSPGAGTHCVGWLPQGWDDVAIARKAAAADVSLVPVSKLSVAPLARGGFVLGYGAFSEKQIRDAIRRLGTVMAGDRRVK